MLERWISLIKGCNTQDDKGIKAAAKLCAADFAEKGTSCKLDVTCSLLDEHYNSTKFAKTLVNEIKKLVAGPQKKMQPV